jgi:hypothetical protein
MVCFQPKNPNLGKFWRVLQWKMFVYFMDTWSILRSFVLVYGQLVYFVVILVYFFSFWYFVPPKSGNSGQELKQNFEIMPENPL